MFKSPEIGRAYRHKEFNSPKTNRAFPKKKIFLGVVELSLRSIVIVLANLWVLSSRGYSLNSLGHFVHLNLLVYNLKVQFFQIDLGR